MKALPIVKVALLVSASWAVSQNAENTIQLNKESVKQLRLNAIEELAEQIRRVEAENANLNQAAGQQNTELVEQLRLEAIEKTEARKQKKIKELAEQLRLVEADNANLNQAAAHATEVSSLDLKKAQNGLQGFEISGRGIQPPSPFVYEGMFPGAQLEAELESSKKVLLASGDSLPVYLTNAFKRDNLSDAELVIAVRGGRACLALTDRAMSAKEKRASEQAGAGQPATRSETDSEGSDKPQPESEGRSR
jgi:hypothetical protein